MMIDATTGKWVNGVESLRRSIIDVLTTPVGSRVLNPSYGSRLFSLLDRPIQPVTIIFVITEALTRFVPKFHLADVSVKDLNDKGEATLSLRGEYQGSLLDVEVVL